MGSVEILVLAIRIAQYFCIDMDLMFHHSIAYWYQLTMFLCIADTSILVLFLSTLRAIVPSVDCVFIDSF